VQWIGIRRWIAHLIHKGQSGLGVVGAHGEHATQEDQAKARRRVGIGQVC